MHVHASDGGHSRRVGERCDAKPFGALDMAEAEAEAASPPASSPDSRRARVEAVLLQEARTAEELDRSRRRLNARGRPLSVLRELCALALPLLALVAVEAVGATAEAMPETRQMAAVTSEP